MSATKVLFLVAIAGHLLCGVCDCLWVYPKFCVNSKKQCKTRISQERAGSGAIRCPLDYIIACRTGRVKGGAKRRSSKRPQGAKTLDAVRPVCYSSAFVADRKSAQFGSRSS